MPTIKRNISNVHVMIYGLQYSIRRNEMEDMFSSESDIESSTASHSCSPSTPGLTDDGLTPDTEEPPLITSLGDDVITNQPITGITYDEVKYQFIVSHIIIFLSARV